MCSNPKSRLLSRLYLRMPKGGVFCCYPHIAAPQPEGRNLERVLTGNTVHVGNSQSPQADSRPTTTAGRSYYALVSECTWNGYCAFKLHL